MFVLAEMSSLHWGNSQGLAVAWPQPHPFRVVSASSGWGRLWTPLAPWLMAGSCESLSLAQFLMGPPGQEEDDKLGVGIR